MTSGSSGAPKLVQLPAAALRASAAATAGPARRAGALAARAAGQPRGRRAGDRPVVAGRRSSRWCRTCATGSGRPGSPPRPPRSAAGRRYTSLVPTQLGRLLDAGGAALEALRSYHAVLVGGAALDPGLRARAVAAGVRVVTTYGMSETAGGCVYDGVPLDGVRVRLDADGGIRLGGPTLASGYLGRPELTARAFADGWFRTGDHGRWRDGRLEVLGRLDDMIITGGEKVAPAARRAGAADPARGAGGVRRRAAGPGMGAGGRGGRGRRPGRGRSSRTGCSDAVRAELGPRRPGLGGCARSPRSRCSASASRTAPRSPSCFAGTTARPGDGDAVHHRAAHSALIDHYSTNRSDPPHTTHQSQQ